MSNAGVFLVMHLANQNRRYVPSPPEPRSGWRAAVIDWLAAALVLLVLVVIPVGIIAGLIALILYLT